ncbi:MAG TPA: type VI secretion system baseplate subunit TssG [Janthinobacterium sp.]|jgi:type VI secretion system protein ImpH|nr:type VI secretion system baseplate subunit TssG [Janthinobacterium sp.]
MQAENSGIDPGLGGADGIGTDPVAAGGIDPSVIQRLLEKPQRFQFFQAVRLLLAWLGERGVAADRALVDYLRFDNSVSLSFPASQIESLSISAADDEQAPPRQVRITPSFMGFLGSHGVLPSHYSERIATYQHGERDESPRAFLDMFSTRVLALFYLSWSKYRVEHLQDRETGRFLPLLLSLAGCGHDELDNGGAIGDEAIAFHAGLLQQRPMSSVIMARVMSGYFGVPFLVDESVGHMNPMTQPEQTALGGRHAMLGDRAMLGERSWRPDLRARLRIGPMDRRQFEQFLPGGAGAIAIQRMLSLFGNQGVGYEIRLTLRAEDVGGIRLGQQAPAAQARLGWDSFLLTQQDNADRSDVRYELCPMAPFPGTA